MAGPLIASGIYTGNGVDNRAITGVGFQPKAVIIRGASRAGVLALDTMPTGQAKPLDLFASALGTDRVESLDADGFTVGTHNTVNESGRAYIWVAFGGDDVFTTSWTGNGADNRNINGAGFTPDLAFVVENSYPSMRTSTFVGDLSKQMASVSASANYIQSFHSDGIQVGSALNGNTQPFYAMMLKGSSGVAEVASYTGTGSAHNENALFTFQPEIALIAGEGGVNPAIKTTHNSTNESHLFGDTTTSTGGMMTFMSNGFSVGTSATANSSGVKYNVIAFKNNQPAAEPMRPAFDIEIGLSLDAAPVEFETMRPAFDIELGARLLVDPNPIKQPRFDLLLGLDLDADPNVIKRLALDLELGLGLSGLDAQLVKQVAFDLVLGLGLDLEATLEPIRRAAFDIVLGLGLDGQPLVVEEAHPKFDLVLGLGLDTIPVPIRQAAFDLVLALGIEPDPDVVKRVALNLLLGLDLDATAIVPGQSIKLDIVLGLGLDTVVSETNIARPAFNIVLGLDMLGGVRVTRRAQFDLMLGTLFGVQYAGPGTGVVVTPSDAAQRRRMLLSSVESGGSVRVIVPRGNAAGVAGLARMRSVSSDERTGRTFDPTLLEDGDVSLALGRRAAGQTARPSARPSIKKAIRGDS